MLANTNKTNTRFGQVIEYMITLEQSDITADLKQHSIVFKNTATGENIVRIKETNDQLYYNVFIGGDWDETDIPLTLTDPDELRNLPVQPDIINDDTYARMDTSFHLYKEGTEYVRIEQGSPNKIFYTFAIAFQRTTDPSPKLTIDASVTTSAERLDMSSQRISSLADPTSATDAVNRQFLDKYDVPIGTVLSFYGNTTPAGYLWCNGSTFVAENYPELYTLLGGNTLPDLRGEFLRGTSDSNAVDPDGPRAAGSSETDGFKSHSHTGSFVYTDSYYSENLGLNQGFYGEAGAGDNDNNPLTMTRSAGFTTDTTGISETRPKNIAVRFIIKAKLGRNI